MSVFIRIKPNIGTPRFLEAMAATVLEARISRKEFITPEMLLMHVACQIEFVRYCLSDKFNIYPFMDDLSLYVSKVDKVPENEKYVPALSHDMVTLLHLLGIKSFEIGPFKNEETPQPLQAPEDFDAIHVVGIPELLAKMYELNEDSMAAFLLRKHLGETPRVWETSLKKAYEKDRNRFIRSLFGFLAEGKTEDDERTTGNNAPMSPQDFFERLQNNAEEVLGMLESVADTRKEEPAPREQEPWEELVTCLNETYQLKNPLIGREKELDRCIRILCRKDKNNPLFIGEPGVGKTALIYGLTRMIEEGRVPQWIKGQTIYALDMASMLAGTSYHGEFEKRMKMVLEGAKKRRNCILYIDEIHTICNSGGGNQSMNAEDILKPYLEDGSIRFIGSTTYQDYNKSIANKKAIARRFGQIDVKEPSCEQTVEIILGLLPHYEMHHGVKYDSDAIRYAVEQADVLIHDRFLPDKAIDIIDEAGAFLQQNPLRNKQGKPKQARYQKVDVDVIRTILTDVCRIDANALKTENNGELKDLGQRIGKQIYGQDEAIRQVVRSVMLSKAGLMEPDKPMASLLFVGPTGVGKTEVCKVLAQELGIQLVRFDMSEYTEKHTISKLIGSPAGYVGYDEGGLLTDAIRKTPNCVLLLDEIEKAHSDIYNILLQVMDYARLTDNKGNKADFRNVILVMTSNAGAQFAGQASVGFSSGESKGKAMLTSVRKVFKPEFLNRLSATVVFNDMNKSMAALILDKKLHQLSQRLEARNVTLSLSDEAREFLLEKGFNTQYGAREMDRTLQQFLTPCLMEEILFGKLANGGTAHIIRKDDGLAID